MPVSNQQPPYGQPPQQPPYGQQPQYQGQPPYGQQQYGGYPPPPPPSGSNKTILIVFTVVVVMVVLGAGLFVITRFTGGSDDTAGTTPTTSQPTSDAPSDGGSPTEPANDTSPSAQPTPTAGPPSAACRGCFPGMTVNSLVKALKAKGYVCKTDKILGIDCTKGNLTVGIDSDYKMKNQVENVDVSGESSAMVQNCSQCIKGAVAALKQGLPGVLPLFIPDASHRRQIIAFAAQGAGIPASGPSSARDLTIEGFYRASTQGYSGATVGKNGRYSSSYSTSVSIYGWSS